MKCSILMTLGREKLMAKYLLTLDKRGRFSGTANKNTTSATDSTLLSFPAPPSTLCTLLYALILSTVWMVSLHVPCGSAFSELKISVLEQRGRVQSGQHHAGSLSCLKADPGSLTWQSLWPRGSSPPQLKLKSLSKGV